MNTPSTKTLLMNQLVVQMFHCGASRNSTNLVTTMITSTEATASASLNR